MMQGRLLEEQRCCAKSQAPGDLCHLLKKKFWWEECLSGGKLEMLLFIGRGRAGHSLPGVRTTRLSHLCAAGEHSLEVKVWEALSIPRRGALPCWLTREHFPACAMLMAVLGKHRAAPTPGQPSTAAPGGFIPLPPLQTH